VQNFLVTWGYLAVFALTVLESACVPIPSEVTLGLGGALASGSFIGTSQGHLNLALVVVAGVAGSVVGSLLAYVIGRTGGRSFVERYGKLVLFSTSDLARLEIWFSKWGEGMVLYGRVIPVIRTFISLPAGMARMPVARFTVYTAIGVTVWVTLLSSIGFGLGSSWNAMAGAIGVAGAVIAAVLAVVLAGVLAHRLRSRLSRADTAGSDRGTAIDRPGGEQDDVSAHGQSHEDPGAMGQLSGE